MGCEYELQRKAYSTGSNLHDDFCRRKGCERYGYQRHGQVKAFVGEHFQKNYTAEDIKTAGSRLVNEAGELRTDITSVVLKANKAGEVKEPLGKADKDGLQMVYAVNGGTVTAAGIDKVLGKFLKIETDNGMETYGNFCEITAITGDKIRKGDIIGTFEGSVKGSESGSGKSEFIYQKS